MSAMEIDCSSLMDICDEVCTISPMRMFIGVFVGRFVGDCVGCCVIGDMEVNADGGVVGEAEG